MVAALSVTCYDAYLNCDELAAQFCYQPDIAANCSRSCGLCGGLSPVSSNTCYDVYANCADLCGTLYRDSCKRSCKLC
jgi:hypothetical protein